MWRGWWYDFQWLLSFYLFTFMKEERYILDNSRKYPWKDFSYFIRKLESFKKKCLTKYWNDFNLKAEILVEWEEKCLDDITLISNNNTKTFDNNIFIQVKTKWWDEDSTISTSDWIYKAIKVFLHNINFQKDKSKCNIYFFIFTNRDLTRPLLKKIKSKSTELYLIFANYIISKNKDDDSIYPVTELYNLKSKFNKRIITDILNNTLDSAIYSSEYDISFLEKFKTLISDLQIIFNNLSVITKIDHDILEAELYHFYGEPFYKKLREISKLCWEWTEIKKGTNEFERYEKYKYTYFSWENWWKFVNEIDSISKWKFI